MLNSVQINVESLKQMVLSLENQGLVLDQIIKEDSENIQRLRAVERTQMQALKIT